MQVCQDGKRALGHPAGMAVLASSGQARCQLWPARAGSWDTGRDRCDSRRQKHSPGMGAGTQTLQAAPLVKSREKCLGKALWCDSTFIVTRNLVSSMLSSQLRSGQLGYGRRARKKQ